MKVHFREIDPFNCWLWLRFSKALDQGERNYIDGLFDSWYVLGRLGGFNSSNLQANEAGVDLSWMNYIQEDESSILPALMHNLGQLEYNNEWGRCWVDLGTSDPLAIDILINSLNQVDSDFVEIEELFIGGVNDDWNVDEDHPDSIFPSVNK